MSPQSVSSLPKSPGVYFFKNEKSEIIYVGKAKNLRDRVSSYFRSKDLSVKTATLVSQIVDIDFTLVESEIDALLYEANCIRKLQPKYNISLKDSKSYPLVEITVKDPCPKVSIVRSETNSKAVYFGPFPTGSNLFYVMKFLRHIFPYVSAKHRKNEICFRSHLGLCPCMSLATTEGKKEYKKTIKRIIEFLSGNRTRVQKNLEKEMLILSKSEKYEEANKIKNMLDRIAYVTATRTKPFEYETNPTLVDEKRELGVKELQELLGIGKYLERIECFDISNTSGKEATAAMVVYTNGVKDSGQYRRFKIKFRTTPGDLEMMEETLMRRFKHCDDSSWPLPDLLVVDGGAGQLGVARKVLTHYELDIPVIGLAKRLEEIYLDTQIKFAPPRTNKGLQLLQQMRDEAHRSSRRYHFLLRKKKMLE